ncbi:hypothetical protein [Tessaracoccus flavus]|uniref:hypothetical protein n=1 Tax=Tessaracoccus flavus TaxID=1610493 RepID=UPI00089AEBCC|nr:hypothetical protein [Tessaracoccus flavus]SDZ17827.1 hypothetical protein SAMN05428934_1144 [Tessaracoccus flavus]
MSLNSTQFLEGGKAGIEAGKSKPTSREQQLEDEVAELTQALGEAAVEIRVWKKSAEGRLGPSRTSRWCSYAGEVHREWISGARIPKVDQAG